MVEVFNFCLKFSIFKGVSPRNKWRNPKKILKFDISMVRWIEVIIIVSHYKYHEKILVVVEVFNFMSKFSNFKGVSPRNKWRNTKKIEIFDFNGMMERGDNYFFLIINNMKKFMWWWKSSIFCRNSWVIKVLAHEISDED